MRWTDAEIEDVVRMACRKSGFALTPRGVDAPRKVLRLINELVGVFALEAHRHSVILDRDLRALLERLERTRMHPEVRELVDRLHEALTDIVVRGTPAVTATNTVDIADVSGLDPAEYGAAK